MCDVPRRTDPVRSARRRQETQGPLTGDVRHKGSYKKEEGETEPVIES